MQIPELHSEDFRLLKWYKIKSSDVVLIKYSLMLNNVKCRTFIAIDSSKDWRRKSIEIYYFLMNGYKVINPLIVKKNQAV